MASNSNSDRPTASNATQPTSGLTRHLLWLNAGLLIALAAVHFAPAALGQAGSNSPNRGRGEYLLIAGEPEDGNLADIFVIDIANQEAIGLRWDPQRNEFRGLGYRNLNADINARGKP